MIVLYAIVGLLVGGVLNTLADTMPQKAQLRPPYCTHCDVQRRPAAWLTTAGYLLDRGRCRSCGEPLQLRGVWVELGTATAFAFVYYRYGLTGQTLLISVYMAVFILITAIDLEHRLILNRVIGPAILLALIAGPFMPGLNWKRTLVGGLVGFGFFYVIALLNPGGMGAGDVKLAAFIGLITGFPVVIVALLIGIFAGGLASIFLVATRIRSRRDYIPYGPFLVIGGVFALFWGQPIVDDYLERNQRSGAAAVLLAQEKSPTPYWAMDEAIDWTRVWESAAGQSIRSSSSPSSSRSKSSRCN